MQRTWAATTAMAIVLGAAGAAAAQSAAKPDAIGEIVVTAQKRSENIQKVPISIQAFTAKDIRALGIKSSSDLGQMSPNVDIALPAGAGNQPIIAIRGIGLNDYDTNNAGPNGVYVDEVYLSSPASQTFQTFDLQRVEVLKGPQGTLYGRNSSGGAINFISNKPTDYLTADVHAEYSSFNTFNIEGGVGGPIAPGLDGRFAFVKNNSEGYTTNALTGNKENGADNAAFRAMLQYKPSDKLTLLFNVHGGYVDNRPAEYRHIGDLSPVDGSQCSVAATYAGGCVDAFGYGTPSKFYGGSYNRQQHLKVNSLGSYLRADYSADSLTYTSITAVEHVDKIHPEDSDASPNQLLEIDFGVRSNTVTQEFQVHQTKDRYNWVLGAYYLKEDLRQNQPLYVALGSGGGYVAYDSSHQITDAYAIYGQGDYAITDKLKLTLGGRGTYEHKSFDYFGSFKTQDSEATGGFDPIQVVNDSSHHLDSSAFSWRAALNYSFTRDILTYVSASTGYKSGGFNGSFLGQDPTLIPAQLKPINPETVTAYEVGIKSSFFDRRLTLNVAGFYNDYKNMQVFLLVDEGGIGVNILTNAKAAHTEGFDIQALARPIDNLTLNAQIGLLNTRLDGAVNGQYVSNQLPLAPRTTAALGFDYKIPLGDNAVDLQFNASYKSHQYFDTTNDPYTTQAAYWLENVRVAYQFNDKHWEVAAFAHNLGDQHYYVDAFDLSFVGLIQGVRGTPRTVGVEANYHF